MIEKTGIILASKSPRRREILGMLGLKFRVLTADTDESCDDVNPHIYTEKIAERKCRAVYELAGKPESTLIIAADTVVACPDGNCYEIMGKPHDRDDACRMLRKLSGRTHSVVSGISVIYNGKTITTSCGTEVTFDDIPEDEIKAYADSGEPDDKAGAYAIQGRAGVFVRGIEGDYYNVVGLPVNTLYRTVRDGFGIILM